LRTIEVENKICAAVGCNKPATAKMVFEALGFSANFCNKCMTSWELKKLGLNKKNVLDKSGMLERAMSDAF
jgi:hypothetical protein